MKRILRLLIPHREGLEKKWWHRLVKVLIYGSTVLIAIIVTVNMGMSLLDYVPWKEYSYPAYSFEENYPLAEGKEEYCLFYVYAYLTPTIKCGNLISPSIFLARYLKSKDEWRGWMEQRKESFVDNGAPLGKTKRVTEENIKDVRNDIGGYSIVRAQSHDAAAKMFEGQPHFGIPGAWIEVMEIPEMPGM